MNDSKPSVSVVQDATPGLVRPEGVPISSYGKKTTAREVLRTTDLRGKTLLITGATSGLGRESATVFIERGAKVWITGRIMAQAQRLASELGDRCLPVELDLSSPQSIVACADRVLQGGAPLDALLCNAGLMVVGERQCIGGIEQHLAVNHLGHFLLVNHLLPAVLAAEQGRVITVSSSAYKWAPPQGIDFENLDGSRDYAANRAYGQSKLANALFSLELARRLQGTKATANSVNPGPVDTPLWRHYPWWQQWILAPFKPFLFKSVAAGAATPCYVATATELASVSGYHFEDVNPIVPPATVRDVSLAQRLWDVSEDLLRPYLV
jgi:NAD(P)-dependent dehydrogenase (short-subunit alcohol dehydrogenase family)